AWVKSFWNGSEVTLGNKLCSDLDTPSNHEPSQDPGLALADAIARRECREYEDMVDRLKEPIFLLHPTLFDAYGSSQKFSAIVAQHAIRPIMKMMAIRRGMLTLTKLPDGTLVSPGADIPPMEIRTERLNLWYQMFEAHD
ncbi:uncharacterized protein TRIREDRAFT_103155, partial [Trichoderma reesei QM6a]